MLSLSYSDPEIFSMLVHRNDIDINTVNNDGLTPLHVAVIRKDFDLVSYIVYLRRNSIPIDARTNDGLSFMHLAAREKSIKLMNIFSGLGLSYNVQDKYGRTPLMILIGEKSPIIKQWEYLINKSSLNINLKDNMGILFLFLLIELSFIMLQVVKNQIFYLLYLEEEILI